MLKMAYSQHLEPLILNNSSSEIYLPLIALSDTIAEFDEK